MENGASYREYAPGRLVQRGVAALWLSSNETASADTVRILPDGCADLMIRYDERDPFSPRLFIVGEMSRFHDVPVAAGSRTLGIRFSAGWLSGNCHVNMRDTADAAIELSELNRRLAGELRNALHAASALPLLRRLELVACRLAAEAEAPHPLISAMTAAMEGPAEGYGVARSARAEGYSLRQAQRLFMSSVGIGPKELARIARYRRALRFMAGGRMPLAAIAHSCGYYDQAHMNREFQRLGGHTPRKAAMSHFSNIPLLSPAIL